MASFKKFYRELFQTLGYPLSKSTSLPLDDIVAAEKRLGVRIPMSLRDFYLVAGRERRFTRCHHMLLPPSKWSLEKRHLTFMLENQAVVHWSVSIPDRGSEDPAVSQGVDENTAEWYPEHRKCSVFLAVMMHYQAVSGGFRFTGQADAPKQSGYRFEQHGWKRYGVVNSLIAYSRSNQVVCLMPPGDLPFMQNWWVLAGAKTKQELQSLAGELELKFN
jgi:hypothetical protein